MRVKLFIQRNLAVEEIFRVQLGPGKDEGPHSERLTIPGYDQLHVPSQILALNTVRHLHDRTRLNAKDRILRIPSG
jgi:hypothetical protein